MTEAATLENALAKHRAGQLDAAEPMYKALLDRDPDNSEALHLLGVIALQRQSMATALEFLDRAIALRSDQPQYHNNRGNVLLALRRLGEAEAAFRRATDLDPTFAEAWFNLGVAVQTQGRLSEARAAYERAIAERELYADARNNLGGILQLEGRVAEAAECFRRALALQPASLDVAGNLARALESLNQLEEARAIAERVLAVDPSHPAAVLVAAILDRREGQPATARKRLEKLLDGAPPPVVEANARAELGQVCDRLGDAPAAFAAFERSNELRARFPDAVASRPERFLSNVHRNAAFVTRERLAAWGAEPSDRSAPAFFVGFPRSGTTLMEQFLSGHPNLVPTEERSPLRWLREEIVASHGLDAYPECLEGLSASELASLRVQYWRKAEALAGGALEGRRLVDNQTLNITDLGLMARLFPGTPIVVALRDPRDVVLSCFMQKLRPNDAMAHFFTLSRARRGCMPP